MPSVKKSSIVFDQKLIIEEGIISSGTKEYSRLRIKREDASAVLLFNTDSNKIILTKQFRYAIDDKVNNTILEILAGKVDKGETPLEAAIREGEEETGYNIKEKNIQFLVSCFATPGYSSEKFHIYFATVSNSDKTSKGGGLEAENESIELVEMDPEQFISDIKNSKIEDAKTYISGLYFTNYIYNK